MDDPKDWNYDRIVAAMSQTNEATGDMLRVLHRGEVTAGMRNRMAFLLRSAADNISRMVAK